jgi:putative membrane protein
MKFIKNLSYFAILLAVLVLGALFAVQNTAVVPLDLLVIYLPERSVALWVLLAFAAGGLIGMLTSIGLVLRLRTALLRVNRQLAKVPPPAPPSPPAPEELPVVEDSNPSKEN